MLAAKLAYHFSFLNPSSAQLRELTAIVDRFAAHSLHAEDASLWSHGHAALLPKRETACLPYRDGGVNHVDLPAFLTALQAKMLALLAQPGRQPWKTLTRALLHHVRPESSSNWAWIYSDTPVPVALPARLAAAVGHMRHAGVARQQPPANTQPPTASPEWRVSPDQLWVADVGGTVSYVHYTGRLLQPGPGTAAPALSAAWQPACVLQLRKQRHLWTPDERAAYDAAAPGDRAAAWPRAPHFLARAAEVVAHPEHVRVAGVSLADYTVREVRRAVTRANPAAPQAPMRPAAMPSPASMPTGGAAGPPAAGSQLAEMEAVWQQAASQLAATPAQHFRSNPVALEPWLHRSSSAAQQQNAPARELRAYGSPSQPLGEGQRRSARLLAQAAAGDPVGGASGAGPSTGPPAAAAAGPAAATPQPPPVDTGVLHRTWQRLWDSHASRAAKVLVYRLQHAYLPCGLYRASKGILPRASAVGRRGLGPHCPHHACGPPGPRVWAGLTHIFLQCPAYMQARMWLFFFLRNHPYILAAAAVGSGRTAGGAAASFRRGLHAWGRRERVGIRPAWSGCHAVEHAAGYVPARRLVCVLAPRA